MRRFPVLWLPLALVVLIANRYTIGFSTRSQLKHLIDTILFEDKLYEDVLSEFVILEESENLPLNVSEKMKNLNKVDPLMSLLALHTPHPHYSGENLNLSLTIVGKSLLCLMYKRMAFHLTLIIGLIENSGNLENFQMRSRIFAHVIPYYIEILSSIDINYNKLLNVYDTVHDMFLSPDKGGDNKIIEKLSAELKSLNEGIKSSCAVNDMKEYCSSLKLENLTNCKDKITNENTIVKDLDAKTIMDTLNENENAILNYFEEMDSLRNIAMSEWKSLLKMPDLPSVSETNEFIRTPLPVNLYREEVEAISEASKLFIQKEKEKDLKELESNESVQSKEVEVEDGKPSSSTETHSEPSVEAEQE